MSVMLNLLSGARNAVTFTFVASAVSNTSSVTIPVSSQAGDVAVYLDYAFDTDASAPATVVPTGFTSVNNVSVNTAGVSARAIVSTKVLESGDPGASSTGMTGTGNEGKIMLVFRPSESGVTVNTGSVNGQAINGVPSNQTITASGETNPVVLVAFGGERLGGGTSIGFSPAGTEVKDVGGFAVAEYRIYNTSPSDTTVSFSPSSSVNTLQSFYFYAL